MSEKTTSGMTWARKGKWYTSSDKGYTISVGLTVDKQYNYAAWAPSDKNAPALLYSMDINECYAECDKHLNNQKK